MLDVAVVIRDDFSRSSFLSLSSSGQGKVGEEEEEEKARLELETDRLLLLAPSI